MKQAILFIVIFFSLTNQVFLQQYPDYQIIVPDLVSMNYACNAEDMNTEVYQDQYNTFFKDVVSDSQGNLYFWGVSPYQYSSSDNYTITFGSNSSSALSFSRISSSGNNNTSSEYQYFIAKYNSAGMPLWVSFMTDPPKKMLLDETENRLYVVYHSVRQIDGISYPTDSIVSSEYNIIMFYDIQTGQVVDYFNRKCIYDFFITGNNKKIVVYLRPYNSTNFEVRYGFFNNNQITKWQVEYGNIEAQANLFFNSFQNTFWYKQGNNYYRLLFHPTEDSLIKENIARPLYYEYVPPYGNYSGIKKFHFLPGGYYLGELYNTSLETTPILVKVDSIGNLVWRIAFKPSIPACPSCSWDDSYEYAIDHDGNVWTDINRVYYDSYLEFTPSGQSYFVNEKNLYLADALWKIDGNTGTLLQAYHKGWGCHTENGGKAIHVTSQNKLIVTMHNRGIVYIPNANGSFEPYYVTCTGLQQSSPFMWVSYDLGDIHTTSIENFEYNANENKFTLYPNPSSGTFTLQTEHGGEFELMDIHGRTIQRFRFQNPTEQIQVNLPKGIYFIREKERGVTQKLIIE
jgi:hypothetical protein